MDSNFRSNENKCFQRAVRFLTSSLDVTSGYQYDFAAYSRPNYFPFSFPEEIFLNLFALDMLSNVLPHKHVDILVNQVQTDNSSRYTFINYFKKENIIPDDTDATSYFYYVMLKLGIKQKNNLIEVANQILRNFDDDDGIITTWIKPHDKGKRPHDASVVANVLKFLTKMELHKEAYPTISFVEKQLKSGDFLKGQHYYRTPALFLYYVSGLLTEDIPFYSPLFSEGLVFHVTALVDSVGLDSSPLHIALLMLSIKNLVLSGLGDEGMSRASRFLSDKLVNLQESDGGWATDAMYLWPSKGIWLASRSLSSIFATAALQFALNNE